MFEYRFTEICSRVAMSIVFKYYWHVKEYRTQPLQREVKDFYHHTCNEQRKLASVVQVAQRFFHSLFDVSINRGNITITSTNVPEFESCVEQYVDYLSSRQSLLANPADLASREQIRVVPFHAQVSAVVQLLRHLVEDEFVGDHTVLLREVDLNDFDFGDYEKFCQEEVLIWLQMQGRLKLKKFAGVKERMINGRDQFIWLFNVELINQFRYGPFFIDYDEEIIKYNNQITFAYATSKGKPYAWGLIFRMLIEASGRYVTSQRIQEEFRKHHLKTSITRVVTELHRKMRDCRVPAGYFPRASSGRGSRGYYLRDQLPRGASIN